MTYGWFNRESIVDMKYGLRNPTVQTIAEHTLKVDEYTLERLWI